MKRLLWVSVTFLLLVIPAQVFAKGQTVKITIKGADLKTPIEITDPKVLTEFQVWSGPGTSSSAPGFNPNAPGFIVDWSQAVAEPPKGLQRYEVSFYAKIPTERLIYVVFYEYDPATEHGYIYGVNQLPSIDGSSHQFPFLSSAPKSDRPRPVHFGSAAVFATQW